MGLSHMKDELHNRLWAAQQRWFALREQGISKYDLKMQGLQERGNMFYASRRLLFTGKTRLEYERELKHFVQYAYKERGKTSNSQINKRDFKAYMEHRMAKGGAASTLNKIRSAIVKFGAVYGKYESFHAMSKKMGAKIREMKKAGTLKSPKRPRVTPRIREAIIERLRVLDARTEARTGTPRAYHLVVRLQKEGSLRAIEATERFKRESLLGIKGDKGEISILGKGGKVRTALISNDLYKRLEEHFKRSSSPYLASRKAYLSALRRATLAVGGRSTASHAHRRTSATEKMREFYQKHLANGVSPKEARKRAIQDTVEHLGHSRWRNDLAKAYLPA